MDESVPTLTVKEVVGVLSEWGLDIAAEEVNKPSAGTVQAIYDRFLLDMLQVGIDDLDLPREAIMKDMEYPVS